MPSTWRMLSCYNEAADNQFDCLQNGGETSMITTEGHMTPEMTAYLEEKAKSGCAVVTYGEAIPHSTTGKSHNKQLPRSLRSRGCPLRHVRRLLLPLNLKIIVVGIVRLEGGHQGGVHVFIRSLIQGLPVDQNKIRFIRKIKTLCTYKAYSGNFNSLYLSELILFLFALLECHCPVKEFAFIEIVQIAGTPDHTIEFSVGFIYWIIIPVRAEILDIRIFPLYCHPVEVLQGNPFKSPADELLKGLLNGPVVVLLFTYPCNGAGGSEDI